MSESERSGAYPEGSDTPISSEDAAELEQLRREAAVLRAELEAVAGAPASAALRS